MARRPATGRQRGSVTIEMVILFPVLLMMLFGAVQGGLWFHARSIAMSAAQEGARVAAAYESTTGMGATAARDFAAQAGAKNVTVTASATGTTATVIVSVEAPNLIPFLIPAMPIHQSATMPLERIT
ncbi:TadE family protein [Tessaracoccus coleopterorum]|uniref:TadE family protein n=1 Tax=Tessaracoccus coleopterorum TaxID=2714950 RepID=UPI002F918AA6